MGITDRVKSRLLRNSYVKKLNTRRKAGMLYRQGLAKGVHSKKIVFWSTGGMIIQSHLEGIIAAALKLRGHNVKVVLCDGLYKACAKRVDFPEAGIDQWAKYCPSCIRQNSQLFDRLGLDYVYIGELVSPSRAEDLRRQADKVTLENYKELSYNGLNVGNHLESAMNRHTRGGGFKGHEALLREYAYAVLVSAAASAEYIRKEKPERMYMSHGIYADWGPPLSEALKAGIPVSSYICCYLNAHFFFGTVSDTHETFLSISKESWDKISSAELSETARERVEHFLDQRYMNKVSRDMHGILKNYKGDRGHFMRHYGLEEGKPVWGIMTHINWDAASDYFPMIYKDFDTWLYETIKTLWNMKDVQWLIKIHPSEINDNPLTGCQKFIEKNFPDLPPHIKVLKMDDDISPLDFYSLLDGGVTVMGTGGLELSLQGKPVILAGEAHYSGKGFTYDAKNESEYSSLLSNASRLGRLDDKMSELAWKYGYTYFIRKQVPLTPTIGEDLHIDFALLDHLLPGKNPYMDFLCDRIIDGKDFILPEELVKAMYAEDKEQIRQAM
ncbi:MAG: hypothetical protein K1X85_13545 [Ignavibacteria bacterium]|nr:hypothetical protein [Ignavibacteria bacterium]